MTRKIAFVGAQGTGKTTLMNEVKKKLEERGLIVAQIDEQARKCPFPLDKESDFSSQFYIMTAHVNEENLAALKNPDVIITDRCALDSLVYWSLIKEEKLKNAEGKEADKINSQDAVINAILTSTIESFDALIHVKVSDEAWKTRNLSDGVRCTDFEWYKKVSDAFEKTIKEKGIEVNELFTNGSVEESVARALEIIGTNYETEAKYKVSASESQKVKEHARLLSFSMAKKTRQKDTYFKLERGKLRIREEENGATLTHKGEPLREGGIKSRKETEVIFDILDAYKLKKIIGMIGIGEICEVVKQREEWKKDDVTIAFDEVEDCGNFVEIESLGTSPHKSEKKILEVSKALNLKNPVRESYSDLTLSRTQ